MTTNGDWNPEQYARFRAERSQPFYDLAALVQPHPGMRVLDLGCGDGRQAAYEDREPSLHFLGKRSGVPKVLRSGVAITVLRPVTVPQAPSS